ncbi:MAG: glycosyltransferase family 4 protein [Gammaproteobacteria bacterium]
MRVCFPFVGDSIGGSHLSTLILAEQILSNGWQPLVVVHEEGVLTAELKRRDIPYELLPIRGVVIADHSSLNRLLKLLWVHFRVTFFLLRSKVDLVHSNDMRMHITWALPAKLCGRKHVWHQRTVFPQSRVARIVARWSDVVISISNYVQRSLPKEIAKKSQVIINPVAPVMLAPGTIRRFRKNILVHARYATEPIIVGSFGSLTKIKRPEVLVESCRILQSMMGAPLLLAVFGKDKEGFEQKLRLRTIDDANSFQVVFFGLRTPIEGWMASCDLVMATSELDGFGRTLAEAMSLGVPVVATKAGGHLEVLRDGISGKLAAVNDPHSIARAAYDVLTNEELRDSLVAEAQKISKTTFDPENHARQIAEVYWKLQSR